MPSVGSSSSSSFGPAASARAIASCCLLAAGEVPAAAADHLLQHREQLEQLARDRRGAGLGGQAHQQVVAHRQPAEDLAALRHVADAGAHPVVRRRARDVLAGQRDAAALHGDAAHQAFQQRRLADAVAAEHDGDLADLRFERAVAQDMAAAIELVEGFDFQHVSGPGTPRPPSRCSALRSTALPPTRCLRAAPSPSSCPASADRRTSCRVRRRPANARLRG